MRRRTRRMILLVLLVISAAGIGYGLRYGYDIGLVRFNYPDTKRFPLRGIDVSHHQGKIDWNALPAEHAHFIFIKATEGGDHKDRRFKTNWDNAYRYGLARGAYHFFTFCKAGKQQAENFIATVPVEEKMLPPVIDIEYGGNCKSRPEREGLLRELREFAVEVEQVYRRKPIFYVTEEIYADYLRGEITDYPVWIRDIYFEPSFSDRSGWLFWQYANRGRIKGIQGPVDLNVFNGDAAALEQLQEPITTP
ncbi:MAG: glycoside hydrolase family 25 protein [Gammaproteobacteria bacterium]|nr:glycoside hydrolase family 25 protein [Gammaproteobacteria bacterium]